MEDLETEKAEGIVVDKWPQPTEFRSWRLSFKSEVSLFSQHPRATMLWIGEVEDAKSIDDLITSASTTSRQYTHKHCTYSAVQPVHKRGTHRTRLAQVTQIAVSSLCVLKRVCHLVSTCLTLCCSLTCRAPRAHLLPHSLFLPPRHQNTHYNWDNTIYSKNIQCIINLSKQARSKSIAIKKHSGMKTYRVTETCATPSPQ